MTATLSGLRFSSAPFTKAAAMIWFAWSRVIRRTRFSHYWCVKKKAAGAGRSEEHTSEHQSLMRISYSVFCLKKKKTRNYKKHKISQDADIYELQQIQQ